MEPWYTIITRQVGGLTTYDLYRKGETTFGLHNTNTDHLVATFLTYEEAHATVQRLLRPYETKEETVAFPYTDAQVEDFATRDPEWMVAEGDTGYARKYLTNLAKAGITVTFPEPRYYVSLSDPLYHARVKDRRTNKTVAWFHRDLHPDSKAAAQAEADRLNREVQE